VRIQDAPKLVRRSLTRPATKILLQAESLNHARSLTTSATKKTLQAGSLNHLRNLTTSATLIIMLQIVTEPIDTAAVLHAVHSDVTGASVLFSGTTRQFTAGRETVHLEYEAYEKMAIGKIHELREQAMQKFEIEKVAIVHRLGVVSVGECSVAIAVSSPHRGMAFDAASWLIDTLKEIVPIWKQENFSDGSQEWIHPDAQSGG
jgi:molybdopterin synthase catalytic subunit